MRIEAAMHHTQAYNVREAKRYDLDFPHIRDVREDIRTTCFAFCHLSSPAA